jgi:hypothetical protein
MAVCLKKSIAVGCLLCSLMVFAHAQETTLILKNGKALVKKTVQPRRPGAAHFYFLKLSKGQMVRIKVDSNEVFFSEENGCAVYFQLFDDKGKELFLGDAPVGIDEWEGEITGTGKYKIRLAMQCMESFTTHDVVKRKPRFKYSLAVQMK